MACDNQKKLATIIKNTHSRLREDYQKYGSEEAWLRHVAQTDNLQKYAASMQELATAYWNPINNNTNEYHNNTRCRIQWIKNQCYDFFLKGGREKFIQREVDIIDKLTSTEMCICSFSPTENTNIKKIDLLDVGSCYNPFADDKHFNVTAIDLTPSIDTVLECDFLNVDISDRTIISSDKKKVLTLTENKYDVCVFSLLLEYFPCSKQRFSCCERAYKLLKDSGLLIIITPDSKHANANAKIMKSWRYVLANLGFMRITYEKLKHLHCITFRKCVNKEAAARWITLQHNIPNDDVLFASYRDIYIPQDFQSFNSKNSELKNVKFEASELIDAFNELPDFTD